MNNKICVDKLVHFLSFILDRKIVINTKYKELRIVPIDQSGPGDISWATKKSLLKTANRPSVLISDQDIQSSAITLTLVVKNPREVFTKIMSHFFTKEVPHEIADTAIIKSMIPVKEISVGHYSCIGENVSIGRNTVIEDHVTVLDDVSIGENCLIKSGARIGSKGFGFQKIDNSWEKIIHIGSVVICDNVEIGANTVVCRGTLGSTYIGANSKIDDLVFIAHNVNIGEQCLLVAKSLILGSVDIGDNVWVGGSATIRDGLSVGDNAFIGMGSCVVKPVNDNDIVAGNPAKVLKK